MMNLTDSCGVLSVDIGPNFGNHLNIYESFNEIVVDYNAGGELGEIITAESMVVYNKVFRFLFKIKWALWTLENFKFPTSCKKNDSPFKKIQLFDIVARRLCITKHWLIYLIQTIHYFTSMHLLHLSKKFEKNSKRARNVQELKKYHEEFIAGIEKFAFQDKNSKPIVDILLNMLKIVLLIKNQWTNLCMFEDPGNVDHLSDSELILSLHTQANDTEASYVKYHEMFVQMLNHFIGKGSGYCEYLWLCLLLEFDIC
jgi:gamma-tubulin complex component 5